MKLTINTTIKKLFKKKLISEKSYSLLKELNVNDTFDIMTTKFPEEKEVDEINDFTNYLYKTL